jgi:integrase
MPWLEKRGGTYRVKFRFGGKVRQAALKTGDETAAKTALAKFEETLSDVLRGRLTIPDGADVGTFLLTDGKLDKKPVHVAAPPALTIGELFAHYQTHLTPGAKEANTRKCEGVHIRHLARLLGGKTAVEKIGTAQVQEYVDRRAAEKYRSKPIKPQTVRKEVATLITVWNWAHRRDRAPAPCSTKGVTFPKGGERERFRTYDEVAEIVARGGLSKTRVRELWDGLFLRKEEIDEVLAHVRTHAPVDWLYPFFVVAAHTGARRSELLRARVEDFDFENKVVTLREKKKSRTKETLRTVDMSSLVQAVMRKHLASPEHPGGAYAFCATANVPISDSISRKAFRGVMRTSKWKVLRGYHVFRHSFASLLAAEGKEEHVISALMGHLTAEMRARYRHLFPQDRRTAVVSVFG